MRTRSSWSFSDSGGVTIFVGCSIGTGVPSSGSRSSSPSHIDLQFQAVPLATLPVDRVHGIEGPPVPFDLVVDLVLDLLDLLDRPRPAAQGDVGEVGVGNALLDPDLVPDLESSSVRRLLGAWHVVESRGDGPPFSSPPAIPCKWAFFLGQVKIAGETGHRSGP